MIKFETIVPDDDTKRIVTETIQSMFILHQDYFEMIEEYYADLENTDDPGMPKENSYLNVHCISKREKITTIQKMWYRKSMVWGVKISVEGTNDDSEPIFKTEEEADKCFITVKEWAFLNKRTS
jgi:hypothetical protein